METPVRGPIIIEFNGLPGCGKSTTANALVRSLELSGFECTNSYYRKSRFKNKIWQVCWSGNFRLLIKICRLLFVVRNVKDALPGVLALCKYHQMYRMFSRDLDDKVLVIDQGLIQGILSVFHCQRMEKSTPVAGILKLLVDIKCRLYFVNCKISVEESLCRIDSRPKQYGRLDAMDHERQRDVLSAQLTNITILQDDLNNNMDVNVINISTKDCVEYNVGIIAEIIYEKYEKVGH